ncbi:MAG: helix-turn-helix domain-containing protein [Micromonosporaceae bacterium]|nr:helix-turn-helix domain-containing protein [Micromonosporaceae bacterium]
MSDPRDIVDARRILGRRLASCRQAAGLNQTRMAELVRYSRSTVANVETGRQAAPRDFWSRCDAVLSAVHTFVAEYERIEHRRWHHDSRPVAVPGDPGAEVVLVPEARGPALMAGTDECTAGIAGMRHFLLELSPHWLEALPLPADTVIATGAAALRWLVAPPEPAKRLPGHGCLRVGQTDVDRIRDVRRHLKTLDNAYGGGSCLSMATAFLRYDVAPMLEGCCSETIGQQLLAAVAECCLDVGWMVYDSGAHQAARTCLLQSLRLSHAAAERLLGGRVLTALSHQALHLGHHRTAVDLARAARSGTDRIAPATAVAMMAAMEAMSHAAVGDRRSCCQALFDAENALARVPAGEERPDWLEFDAGGLSGHAARAYRYLHDGAAAMRHAQDAIAGCHSDHGRTLVQRTAILAAAHVEQGNLDEAAHLGSTMVDAARHLRSRHVYEEVSGLAQAVRGRPTPVTQDFLDQADEYLLDPPIHGHDHRLDTT